MSDSQLFLDSFNITEQIKGKYDRVHRLSAQNEDASTTLTLDVNIELFPFEPTEHVDLMLASTLSLDGTRDDGKGWRDVGKGEQTLADSWDYVCHGKVYRFEDADDEKIKVFVSFGGLLLFMEGPYKKLTPLRIDYVYLLLKK